MEVAAIVTVSAITSAITAGIGGYFLGTSHCPAQQPAQQPAQPAQPAQQPAQPAQQLAQPPAQRPAQPPAQPDWLGVSREPVETRWGGTADLWLRRTGTPIGEWVRVGVIYNDTRTLPFFGRWREEPSGNRYDYGAQTEDGVFTELVTDVPWLWSESTLETTVLGRSSPTWTVRLFDGVGSRSLR
jgi:hypothetical protein